MFCRLSSLHLSLLLLFSLIAIQAYAQPVLPNIAGATDKGVNILTWTSQFEGVKSIAVQRSKDSTFNYITVGYVKNLKRGIQVFADGHPLPGDNWYQLYILFNSNLTWVSNRIKVYVDSAVLATQSVVLPPNDSLQKFIVSSKEGNTVTTYNKNRIVVTLDTTITSSGIAAASADPAIKKAITISLEADPGDLDPYKYIKSQYIFTNPLTGHINVEIPNAKRYEYSIIFFNEKNKQILDIPSVPESSIIIDKRNFQQKGIYKFLLKKNNKMVETGYITIY